MDGADGRSEPGGGGGGTVEIWLADEKRARAALMILMEWIGSYVIRIQIQSGNQLRDYHSGRTPVDGLDVSCSVELASLSQPFPSNPREASTGPHSVPINSSDSSPGS